ncbi:MAG TPA: ribosomal-processing cysteine protease Prp [Clostridia bacterium]|nr:ribosomal-processing cysteine protease Prp [Clostridia bacterium]
MISIIISKGTQGIEAVEIKGHSGYAKSGKDIVCSAVSAITQTALLGLKEVSTREVDFTINNEVGYLKFSVPQFSSEIEKIKQQTVLETMVIGLRDIQKGYDAFVKVEVR